MASNGKGVLVGTEDVEAVNDIDKGHCLVTLPLLEVLDALDEHDEVLTAALVVNLCPVVVGFRHFDGRTVGGFSWLEMLS